MAIAQASQMHALVASKYCTPDGYEIAELPKVEIKDPRDVLVRIHAASINPHDVKEARGMKKIVQKLEYVPI
jgi:NADPH:quinone reductase-like Zn-dependent oxidoreductase